MLDMENGIILTDENGNEKEMEIVLTFDNEETGRNYVLITDPEDEEGEVFAYAYDEEGNLEAIEDETEYALCSEVLGAFISEEE